MTRQLTPTLARFGRRRLISRWPLHLLAALLVGAASAASIAHGVAVHAQVEPARVEAATWGRAHHLLGSGADFGPLAGRGSGWVDPARVLDRLGLDDGEVLLVTQLDEGIDGGSSRTLSAPLGHALSGGLIELVAGRWPSAPDEVVLVLDWDGSTFVDGEGGSPLVAAGHPDGELADEASAGTLGSSIESAPLGGTVVPTGLVLAPGLGASESLTVVADSGILADEGAFSGVSDQYLGWTAWLPPVPIERLVDLDPGVVRVDAEPLTIVPTTPAARPDARGIVKDAGPSGGLRLLLGSTSLLMLVVAARAAVAGDLPSLGSLQLSGADPLVAFHLASHVARLLVGAGLLAGVPFGIVWGLAIRDSAVLPEVPLVTEPAGLVAGVVGIAAVAALVIDRFLRFGLVDLVEASTASLLRRRGRPIPSGPASIWRAFLPALGVQRMGRAAIFVFLVTMVWFDSGVAGLGSPAAAGVVGMVVVGLALVGVSAAVRGSGDLGLRSRFAVCAPWVAGVRRGVQTLDRQRSGLAPVEMLLAVVAAFVAGRSIHSGERAPGKGGAIEPDVLLALGGVVGIACLVGVLLLSSATSTTDRRLLAGGISPHVIGLTVATRVALVAIGSTLPAVVLCGIVMAGSWIGGQLGIADLSSDPAEVAWAPVLIVGLAVPVLASVGSGMWVAISARRHRIPNQLTRSPT